MRTLFLAALSAVCVLSAQTPDFSGVWKANAEKSKMTGPAPVSQIMIVEQKDDRLKETVGVTGPRGEERSMFNFNLAKPSVNYSRGLAMRTEAKWDGPVLVLASKIAAAKPASSMMKVSMAPDGNTLTVETVMTANGNDTAMTVVYDKQPDSAGDALRKPEETAAAHHKNVQILMEMPASQFIDAMRSFNVALGVECSFCHVQGKFEADDKPQKAMARKMLTMTHNINATTFEGKNEVRCYTCHNGRAHPASHPAF